MKQRSSYRLFWTYLLFSILLIACKALDISVFLNNDIFIAHAGGEIDSITYTNSLEALNSSYKKGCRIFELDIIETSDGKFVAAHDWHVYKEISNCQYEPYDIPLTENQFLSCKIHGKYTPLNITRINDWFSRHRDAILVTDKVNSPRKFSDAFLFKDRLRMELFSWDAVLEAIHVGITPMPSECLVFQQGAEEKLYNLNIKYIAISRRVIEANKDFLMRIKSHNIKTYVYHVNFDSGKNEKYVLENEIRYIYGMYADYLDLINQ
jgi:glycerophosphoryl diester phosphodiesterase